MPVAANLYKIRQEKGEAGDFFRSVQRQRDQYQGLWLVSPEGRVLSALHGFKADDEAGRAREVLESLQGGLAAIGPLKPQPVSAPVALPFRGVGRKPDGGVTLALYSRCMSHGRPDGPPVIDSLQLTAEEFAQLKQPAGHTSQLPAWLARRLVRLLSPSSDQSTMPRPDDARTAELGVALDVAGHADVTGRIEANHLLEGDPKRPTSASATAHGRIEYDERTHLPTRILIVFEGVYRGAPPYDAPRETGAVVEWTLR